MTNTAERDVKQLNAFLREELSAVETYSQCIKSVVDPSVVAQLSSLQESHRRRVDLLAARIRSLGGAPSSSSGVWGSFAKMLEGGATMLGQSAAVSALEEGEEYRRHEYHRDIARLSSTEGDFVKHQILPEQERTHEEVRRIDAHM